MECTVSKSMKSRVRNLCRTKSTTPGERLHVDISHVDTESLGGKVFWVLVVDDCTQMKW